jgi:chorismate synthase
MSVQAIKGVEIGLGFESARRPGSEVHDPIHYDPALGGGKGGQAPFVRSTLRAVPANGACPPFPEGPSLGFTRPSNHAGGLEAGMTNAQPIVLRAAMKPIPTIERPLPSVNLETLRAEPATYQRSDVCAVPAASCVVENVVAFEIARAMVDKFGGDSLAEMQARWKLFHRLARERIEQ